MGDRRSHRRGLTNRQIADELGLSTRTVEGHVYRAMTKTDCADRTELGRYAPNR